MPVSWEEVPLLKVALLFIAGLLVAKTLPSCLALTPAIILFSIILMMRFLPGKPSLHLVRVGYWMTIILFFQIGYVRMDPALLNVPQFLKDDQHIVIGEVLETEEGTNRQKYHVKILHWHGTKLQKHQAQRILYYGPKAAKSELGKGDIFLFKNKIYPVEPPQNPHQFNYKQYLLNRDIFGQSFEGQNTRSIILKHSTSEKSNYRDKFLKTLNTHIKNQYASAVCAAILFGEKAGLEREQLDLFRKSGVAHVMAVSGMHVGIIYGIAWFLLARIKARTTILKMLRLLLALSCIWVFIAITGFPPSAVRAGVMFSFILSGKALYLHTNSLNLLSASAILMLMYEPNWIFDIGFQFSYLAVGGIILTFPPINRLIFLPYKPIRWIWSLIAISLSAQLFLLPLSVYYFYGFSPLFWLNSIPAAVLASGTMSISLLIIVFSPLSTSISDFLGSILEKIVYAFDHWLHYVSMFQYSYVGEIGISGWTLFLFMLFSFMVVLLFSKRSIKAFILSGIIFILINLSNITVNSDQKVFIPLYMDDEIHFYMVQGNSCSCISSLKRISSEWAYTVRGFEIKSHLTHCNIVNIFEDRHFYSIPNANILKVQDPNKIEPSHAKNASIVLWWCEEDPEPYLGMMPKIRTLFVKREIFSDPSSFDSNFFTDHPIQVMAPGDPYILH